MSTWLGDSAVKTHPTRKRWDALNGEVQRTPMVGPANDVDQLYQAFVRLIGNKPQYEALEFDPGKGVGTLLIDRVTDGPAVYELYANEFYVPPEHHSFFQLLTVDEIVAVQTAVEDGLDETQSGFAGNQLRLFRHIVNRVELPESGYVLRITQVVSARSIVAAAFGGVNTVQAIPAIAVLNPLIGALPNLEWLKKAPRVMARGRRRSWTIEQEYWGLWKWSVALGGTWLA